MSGDDQARLSCIVKGMVQGVGFRWYTQRVAHKLQLEGWVRNLPDGSVEVQAEGSRAVLEQFLEACRRGPDYSRVDSVAVSWGPAHGSDVGFIIKH